MSEDDGEYVCNLSKPHMHRAPDGWPTQCGQGIEVRERIIRCKDCGRLMDTCSCWCFEHHEYVKPFGFCSSATPKESGSETTSPC